MVLSRVAERYGFHLPMRDRFIRFMNGRYGRLDNVGICLLALFAILCVVNAFADSAIVSILILIVLTLNSYRMFSRNITKRYAEDMRLLRIFSAIKRETKLLFDRLRFVKTNRFRKCPHCKAIIKLPNRRGNHSVVCPKCSEKFDVRIL